MSSEQQRELVYRCVDISDAPMIFRFLKPFMDSNFLLNRELAEIERLTRYGFAAMDGEQVVGFAAVEIYSRKLAELQCLAVSQDYRRMGIGRNLVRHCCSAAKNAGVQELMAISASDEMFKACGFDYSLPNQKRALFYRADE